MGVPSTHIEHHGVLAPSEGSAHLDVGDAVVDGHQRLLPEQTQHARTHRTGDERPAHAGTLGVADAVDLPRVESSLVECQSDQSGDVALVVPGRLPGEEPLSRGSDVGLARVGDGEVVVAASAVANDPDADFVGRSFDAEGDAVSASQERQISLHRVRTAVLSK